MVAVIIIKLHFRRVRHCTGLFLNREIHCLNKKLWEEVIADFPLIRHGPHRKWLFQPFIAVGTCLPSRCLAIIRQLNMQTNRLMGGIHEVRCWDGLGCLCYTPSFTKTGSGIQKLMGSIQIQTHGEEGDLISLRFLQNEQNKLKIVTAILAVYDSANSRSICSETWDFGIAPHYCPFSVCTLTFKWTS
jgi:hypothetical protein